MDILCTGTKLANPSVTKSTKPRDSTSLAAQEIVKRIVGYIYKAAKAPASPLMVDS